MIAKEEQEISLSAMRTEPQAYLYCSDTTWITKMDKYVEANPTDFSVHSEDEFGKTYRFPKNLITIRKQKKEMSDEQKKALSERLKKSAESKMD